MQNRFKPSLIRITKDFVKAIAQGDAKSIESIHTQLNATFLKAKQKIETTVVIKARQQEKIDGYLDNIRSCIELALFNDVFLNGLYSPKPFRKLLQSYPITAAIKKGEKQDVDRILSITKKLHTCINKLNEPGESLFFFAKNNEFTMSQILNMPLVEYEQVTKDGIKETVKFNAIFHALYCAVAFPEKTNLIPVIGDFCRVCFNDISYSCQKSVLIADSNGPLPLLTAVDYLCEIMIACPEKDSDIKSIISGIADFYPELLSLNIYGLLKLIKSGALPSVEFYLDLMEKQESSRFTVEQLEKIHGTFKNLTNAPYLYDIFESFGIHFPKPGEEKGSYYLASQRLSEASYSESHGSTFASWSAESDDKAQHEPLSAKADDRVEKIDKREVKSESSAANKSYKFKRSR